MQSLLSPAESHAFQSFLSTMDYPDDTITAAEWAIYNNSNGQLYSGQDHSLHESDSNPERREALMKATKDLMSLDADSWDGGSSMMNQQMMFSAHGQPMERYDLQHGQHLAHQQHHNQQHQRQQQVQHEQHRAHSFSTGHDIFPFLHNKMLQQQHQHQHRPDELQYPSHGELQQQQHPHLANSSLNGIHSDHSSPTSPHSPFHFQPQHNSRTMPLHPQSQQQRQPSQPHQVHIPAQSASRSNPSSGSRLPPSASSSASTRPSLQASTSSPSTNASRGPSLNNGAKLPQRPRASTSPAITVVTATQVQHVAAKQTLLSPSQKKANHIQSEQKRRANIRRGYEALCETVPALREAIREEEEAERNGANQRGANGTGQRKKSRSKKGQKDEERDKDKLDGRAGPRSENVVLSKTIDHIQALLADRSALLARLHRARSSLPPGHPALTSLVADPPWEREWKGGEGRLGDEDPDGDGSEEDGDDE